MSRGEREVVIDALAPSGEGVAHVDGRAVRVPGALPGERVRVALERGNAALRAILERSPERVEPGCAVFDRCGGCAWQHASPSLQGEARVAILRRALPRELRDAPVTYHPSASPWRWRTRARLAWESDRQGVRVGHRARGSHDVVPARECLVLDARLEAAVATLGRHLGALRGRGEVSLALGHEGKPVASLHPEARELAPGSFAVCDALVADGFAGAALWAPGATAPVTAGDPRPVTDGPDGRALVLGLDGFAQAHATLNRELAAAVAARAKPAGRKVLELYAGAGNFTVMLAPLAASVVAVEADRPAVAALRENLRARDIANVTVRDEPAERCADVRADVVVLDPPRAGAREVCEALGKAPARAGVVYVSCDPPTLGRDLAALAARYEVESLEAFEMFPQTAHVEVVASLVARRGAGRRA